MKRENEFELLLAREFVKVFSRKFTAQFKAQIRYRRKIPYGEFRRFCGRSFGFKKSETNEMLDVLRECKMVELSASGFVVRSNGFFQQVY